MAHCVILELTDYCRPSVESGWLMCIDNLQWRIQDFPERASTPKGGQSIIWPFFPKKLYKSEEFLAKMGARDARPLDRPMI